MRCWRTSTRCWAKDNGAAFLCADPDLTLEPREELAAYTDFINGLQPAASAG
jgi:hypothetical protein